MGRVASSRGAARCQHTPGTASASATPTRTTAWTAAPKPMARGITIARGCEPGSIAATRRDATPPDTCEGRRRGDTQTLKPNAQKRPQGGRVWDLWDRAYLGCKAHFIVPVDPFAPRVLRFMERAISSRRFSFATRSIFRCTVQLSPYLQCMTSSDQEDLERELGRVGAASGRGMKPRLALPSHDADRLRSSRLRRTWRDAE